MIVWTVSDVVTAVLAAVVVLGFMGLGMIYLINTIIFKLTEWREKQWEQRHGRK